MPPQINPEFPAIEHSAPGWQIPNLVSWTASRRMPGELPALVYAKLGENCFRRFDDFSRWPSGWDHGSGEAIAWGTYQNLQAFLEEAGFPTGRPPSLFLTNEGHLEIAWDARNGGELSVTISPEGARLFIGSDSSETEYDVASIGRLARRARELTF